MSRFNPSNHQTTMADDKSENEDYSAYVMTETDFISLMIDLYREQPILWKVKHHFYCNKRKRLEALEGIVKELQTYKPEFTVDALKRKINIIRTNFNKERHRLKRLGIEENEDTATKSRLWYFNELLFLADQPTFKRKSAAQNVSGHRVTNVKKEKPTVVDEMECEKSSDNEQKHSEVTRKTDVQNKTFKNVTITKKTVKNLDKNDEESDVEQYMTITTKYYKKKKTSEELLAKNWAMKLRTLSSMQRVYAEKIINDVLYEGQLGNLNKYGVSIRTSLP